MTNERSGMAKLKLGPIENNTPVKLTLELSASVHRDLVAYAQVLATETDQNHLEPAKLISPMLARFMATDRAFAKLRRASATPQHAFPEKPSSEKLS